jgi:hypothetical protein
MYPFYGIIRSVRKYDFGVKVSLQYCICTCIGNEIENKSSLIFIYIYKIAENCIQVNPHGSRINLTAYLNNGFQILSLKSPEAVFWS